MKCPYHIRRETHLLKLCYLVELDFIPFVPPSTSPIHPLNNRPETWSSYCRDMLHNIFKPLLNLMFHSVRFHGSTNNRGDGGCANMM